MAAKILDNGWISDDFEIGNEPWVLKDALVMPPEQYDALSPEEIAAMKQQRYDNWYSMVTAASAETPPGVMDGR